MLHYQNLFCKFSESVKQRRPGIHKTSKTQNKGKYLRLGSLVLVAKIGFSPHFAKPVIILLSTQHFLKAQLLFLQHRTESQNLPGQKHHHIGSRVQKRANVRLLCRLAGLLFKKTLQQLSLKPPDYGSVHAGQILGLMMANLPEVGAAQAAGIRHNQFSLPYGLKQLFQLHFGRRCVRQDTGALRGMLSHSAANYFYQCQSRMLDTVKRQRRVPDVIMLHADVRLIGYDWIF